MSQHNERTVGISTCQTAFGWVGIAWSEHGLVALTLPQASERKALDQLPASSDSVPEAPSGLDVTALVDKLRRYFEGQVVTFDEPLDPILGTEFQIAFVFILMIVVLVWRNRKLRRERKYLK